MKSRSENGRASKSSPVPTILCWLLLIVLMTSLGSCTTLVTRWPIGSKEKGSSELEAVRKKSIFEDFVWTVPDFQVKQIRDKFVWEGQQYTFTVNGSQLVLTDGANTLNFQRKSSTGKYYYDLSKLKMAQIQQSRWVSKTVTVPEQVMVTKTRMVPRTTLGANGTTSTSMESEMYTDYETRFVTKTTWDWETYFESAYQVPNLNYFDVDIPGKPHLIIYEIPEKSTLVYYLQNPEYYVAKEEGESFVGTKDVRLLFMDADSNGSYQDPDDRVLFNVWNPYDQNSKYRTINHFMDNHWYRLKEIQEDNFTTFEFRGNRLAIAYANDKYLRNPGKGRIKITNIADRNATVIINGKEYFTGFGSEFPAQFGKYRLLVRTRGHLDFEKVFEINEETPEVTVQYEVTQPAGILKIKNIFLYDTYKVFVRSADFAKVYDSPREINLPFGKYSISVLVNGYALERQIEIANSEPYWIDYEKEIRS